MRVKPALLWALGVAVFTQAVAADDWEDCQKLSPAPASLINKGCTAVLASKNTLTEKQVIAYINRSRTWYWPQKAKGIEDATRAIDLSPALPAAYAARCEAITENADKQPALEAALPDCSRAIELNPNDASGYLARSKYYKRLSYYYGHENDIELAAADRQRAGELLPHDSDYYRQEAIWLHVYRHDPKGAIAALTKAIELNRNDADAYALRATNFLETGELDNAIADFTRALEIAPEAINAHLLRGKAYLARHEYDRAIEDFELELRHPQKNYIHGNPYFLRTEAYMRQGSYSQAITAAAAAFQAEPSEFTKHSWVMAYNAAGKYAEALALLDQGGAGTSSAGIPHMERRLDAMEYLAMGDTHRNMGEYKAALADYDNALTQVGVDEEAYFGRGVTALILEDYPKAIGDFTQAEQHAAETCAKFFRRPQPSALQCGIRATVFGHLARLKQADSSTAEFEAKVGLLVITAWPRPVLDLYLGKTSPEALLASAVTHDDKCEAAFYAGEWLLLHAKPDEAVFRQMESGCGKGTAEYAVAQAELKKLQH
jgi:tetratricopeptide (TPR) repeat protein